MGSRTYIILYTMLALSACTFDIHHEPDPYAPPVYVEDNSPSYIEIYYTGDLMCYQDPYSYPAEWCEWYDDDAVCCVWWASYYEDYYHDGWYEEWCRWGHDYCWEYNGSF